MEDRKPAYWAVIPAEVRYDEGLRPNAKLLYAEISAMSDATGFCWATNRYLAGLFGLAQDTVSSLVGQLAERGYISLEVVRGPKGNVTERRIWLQKVHPPIGKNADTPPGKNADTPIGKNAGTPIGKNAEENSTSKEQVLPPYNPPKGGRRDRVHKDAPDWEPERFARLWAWYPHDKRGNKQRAIRAWEALHPDKALIDGIARALEIQSRTDEWERGVGIPHLSTYLNGYGWEGWDDPAQPRREARPAGRSDLEWI